MGSIDIFKHLSILLGSAVNKSQQNQEKNYWECQESNLEPLGAKQECNPLCYASFLILCFVFLLFSSPNLFSHFLAITYSFPLFLLCHSLSQYFSLFLSLSLFKTSRQRLFMQKSQLEVLILIPNASMCAITS